MGIRPKMVESLISFCTRQVGSLPIDAHFVGHGAAFGHAQESVFDRRKV